MAVGIKVIQHKNSAFSERDWNSSPSADRITTDLEGHHAVAANCELPVNYIWETPLFPSMANLFSPKP